MSTEKQRVVVVGASTNPERYSRKAMRLLAEHGHEVVPIHPAVEELDGMTVVPNLKAVTEHVDTITMYVGAARSKEMADDLTAIKPDRVIFNPGAENPELRDRLEAKGIHTEEACTLVLLNTNQF